MASHMRSSEKSKIDQHTLTQMNRRAHRIGAMSLTDYTRDEKRKMRDKILQENGHNLKGIGELGSSSEDSDCSGFHNCRYGAESIPNKGQPRHNFSWSSRVKR